jgi:hypothetical protein
MINELFLQAEANFKPSGDQATHKTQFLCPSHLCRGVSVPRSHNLTEVSPEPLANCFPSGLKATDMTASVWPSSVLEHLVTERTLNKACG